MIQEDWQSDWNAFVTLLERKLRMGETSSAVSQFFSGKMVIWNGTLDEKSIDGRAPNVGIALPEREIDLGTGTSDVLDGIWLPLDDCAVNDWKNLEIGCSVRFSAIFTSADFIFPPIELERLSDGTQLVFIRLMNGKVLAQ